MHRLCAYSAHMLRILCAYSARENEHTVLQENENEHTVLQENETEHAVLAGWGSGSRVRSTWGTHQPPNYDSDYILMTMIIIIL